MSELIKTISALEQKAASFDAVVSRLMELKQDLDDVESGQLPQSAFIAQIRRMIAFYEPCSAQFLAKFNADGFQEGVLEKYTGSTYREEKINTVKVTVSGQVFINTKSGQYMIGTLSNSDDCLKGLDHILCEFDFVDGLCLAK